jgi:hypothetical protein
MAGSRKGGALPVLLVVGLLLLGIVGAGAYFGYGFLHARGLIGPDEVPEQYRSLVVKAAKQCPVIPPKVFAAQLASESAWDPNAVSPAGAEGIAQFMPATWKDYGVDADGDGTADPFDPDDAIMSAALLNCVNADLVAKVPGDPLRNTLAAYNAGFNTVIRYDGVPPFPETMNYVDKIIKRAQSIVL